MWHLQNAENSKQKYVEQHSLVFLGVCNDSLLIFSIVLFGDVERVLGNRIENSGFV